jgi:hypothetical protein
MRLHRQAIALGVSAALLTLHLAAPAARADQNLYQFLRGPLFQPPMYWTDFADAVNKAQVQASSQQVRILEQQMLQPGLVTRDVPSPFSSSLRTQTGYFEAIGVEQGR